MTPEQIALVQQSFASMQDRLPELGRSFYEHLFASDPELRLLFSTDMEIQQVKFTDELSEIVSSVSNLATFVPRARELGARHLEHQTRARHYRPVGVALLAAFEDVLGAELTPETREAWTLAYNLVAETMQQGAADAARRERT
jgi:nitric oxide dioxygenase